MTETEIEEKVQSLGNDLESPALAHMTEDALWEHVLRVIAETKGITGFEAARLARAALKTRDLTFERWYG